MSDKDGLECLFGTSRSTTCANRFDGLQNFQRKSLCLAFSITCHGHTHLYGQKIRMVWTMILWLIGCKIAWLSNALEEERVVKPSIIQAKSRDIRIPCWWDMENAGFSAGTPWIWKLVKSYKYINSRKWNPGSRFSPSIRLDSAA